MSDPPLEDGRLERVVRRSAAHARRLTASIAGLGSARYTGGVDPIDPVGIAGETATVTGWARAEPRRLVAVVVLVDGEPVALGQVHLADHRTGSGVTPWLAQVPFPEDGTVVVSAVAVLTTGLALLLDRQARVTPTPPPPPPEPEPFVGDLDEPRSGAEVAASLFTVRGWCTIDPIARIEVSIDGRSSPARQMALARPDVASQIDSPHAGFCGYEHVVDLSGHRPGDEVTLTVTGVGPDGARQPIGEAVVRVAGGDAGRPTPTDGDYLAALRARTTSVTSRHRPAAAGVHLFVVTHDLGLGGGQLYLQELLMRLLDAPDFRARVVSPTDGPFRDELESRGVEVHIAGPYPTEPAASESLLRELAFLAGEFEATAVLVNTTGAAGGVELANRLGLPALWAIHESYAPEHFLFAAYGPGGAHPSAADRLEAALSSASAVIFEAEATRQLYCTHGDPRRFVKVPYGIALGGIDAFRAGHDRPAGRAARGWGDDDVVLLCVGTLEPRKAQGSLLRAFAGVAPDHPEAVLVLVGDRGDTYGGQLRAYAERLGLGDRVRIEAVTPDLYDHYATADAFVLGSDVESLPRSALEAMAFGLPAMVADVFGLSELIDDGETGLHVAPRDLAALEAGLRRLLDLTPQQRQALGERGAAHIRATHDSQGYAREYRQLIDALAADPDALPVMQP